MGSTVDPTHPRSHHAAARETGRCATRRVRSVAPGAKCGLQGRETRFDLGAVRLHDPAGPLLGGVLHVIAPGQHVRLVEERQGDLGQVNEVHVGVVTGCQPGDLVRDLTAWAWFGQSRSESNGSPVCSTSWAFWWDSASSW